MNMLEEEWRVVPGFEEYKVSSEGNVTGKRVQLLKPRIDKYGYPTVCLNGKDMKIHRVVALTFLPNPLNLPTVNHINGIKTDNSVNNLEWASRKDQAIHRCKTLHKSPTSEWNRKPICLVKGNEKYYFESFKQADELLGLYPGCLTDYNRKLGFFQGYRIKNVSVE